MNAHGAASDPKGGGGYSAAERARPGSRGDHIGAVFAALSDPTRRSIIDQLARTESATATELAAVVPVTRQAVNKHLQALGRAGFVTPTRDGREVRYSFTPAPLDEAAQWLAREGAKWDGRLTRLRDRLERG